MTDMDMPLPEAIMAPLNNIVEEAESNGNSMESDAWLPNNLLKIQDAIRAYAAAEVAREREAILDIAIRRSLLSDNLDELRGYKCCKEGIIASIKERAAAIRASAPLQCNRVPPALRSAGRRPCTSRAWLSGLRWLRPCFDQALMPGSALSRLPDRLDNPLKHRPRCAVTWGLQLWARCCQVRRYRRRLWR